MMDQLELKRKIFETCRDKQLSRVNELKSVMDDAQKSANEYGGPKDRYDSYRTQLLRKRDMFAQQLAKANEQLDTLLLINLEVLNDKVEFGSVVSTDQQNLFISISTGKFEVEGKQYYAISPKVPVFSVLSGKKQGDEVVFNNNKILIKEVF